MYVLYIYKYIYIIYPYYPVYIYILSRNPTIYWVTSTIEACDPAIPANVIRSDSESYNLTPQSFKMRNSPYQLALKKAGPFVNAME